MGLEIREKKLKEMVGEGKGVVIDFWGGWWGGWKMVGGMIEEVGGEYEGKGVMGKWDVEEKGDVGGE